MRLSRPGPRLGGQVVVDDRLAGARGRAGQPGAALDAAAERGRLGEVDLPDAGPGLGGMARAAAAGNGGLVAAQGQRPSTSRSPRRRSMREAAWSPWATVGG